MRTGWRGLVAAAAICLAEGGAVADSLSTALWEPVREITHDVQLVVRDRVATFTVRRTFHNAGRRPDEAILEITLPPDAAATGLRIRSRGTWYAGQLIEAQEAARRYEQLTRADGDGTSDPALLAWVGHERLSLRVFPVPPGGTSTVEYTLIAPTRYVRGRHVLYYPELVRGSRLATPRLQVAGRALAVTGGIATLEPSDEATDEDRPATPPPQDDQDGEDDEDDEAPAYTRIELDPGRIDTLVGRHGAVPVGSGRTVLRLELDVAPTLRPAPRGAHVVFVVDASRSEGDDGVTAQLALIRGYLAELPDAQVELVVFRRRAARVFGRFVPAPEVGARLLALPGTPLATGNGSNLDEALAVAAQALEGTAGATRVVAMTDGRLRGAFTTPGALAAFQRAPAGTVLHVVLRDGTGGADADIEEVREDTHPLAPLAAGRGGMLLTVDGGWNDVATLRRIARSLVRPVRIDGVEIHMTNAGALQAPATLPEGTGLRETFVVDTLPRSVTVRGWIWGERYQQVIAVDPAYASTAAALAFADGTADELSREQQYALALRGQVVSPVTSYLAIEPGRHPALEYIEEVHWGSSSIGSLRCGGVVGHGKGSPRPPIDYVAILRAALTPGVAACVDEIGGAFDDTVTLETTSNEVVDVQAGAASSALQRCVIEAAWSLDLDAIARSAGIAGFPWEGTPYRIALRRGRAAKR